MNSLVRSAAVAAVATGLVLAGTVVPAQAADTATPGFRGVWYPTDWENGDPLPLTQTFEWDDTIPATPTADGSDFDIDDPSERFLFSHTTESAEVPFPTTGIFTFISPRGQETNVSAWNASASLGQLTAPGTWLPNMSPGAQVILGGGNPSGTNAVRAAGGDYSFGIAYTSINGIRVSLDGVFFQHISVEAGTGRWHIDPVVPPAGHQQGVAYGTWDQSLFNGGGGWVAPVAEGPDTDASARIEAEVVASTATDGELELVAPFTAPVTLGNAALNAQNQSVSTGSLGQITVRDARAASRPGWTLTSTVDPFVRQGGTETISNAAFGVRPTIVSGPAGATAGAEQVAGSATYGSTFAERAAGTFGDTVLNADLRFVAPEFATAGTYTSTMTLTLVSK